MADKYSSFSQLASSEPEGSYKIEKRQLGSKTALIAPHGGKIEPGTSEICRTVARDDLTYYLFQGCKPNNNSDLHITSSRFDEPQGLEIAQSAAVVVTFHGQSGSEMFVNVGGLAKELGQFAIELLREAGYVATRNSNPRLQGLDQQNICNRGVSRKGLQLEISRGLRERLVAEKQDLFRFASIIRTLFVKNGL